MEGSLKMAVPLDIVRVHMGHLVSLCSVGADAEVLLITELPLQAVVGGGELAQVLQATDTMVVFLPAETLRILPEGPRRTGMLK